MMVSFFINISTKVPGKRKNRAATEIMMVSAALREKLKLDQPGSPCRIVDEDTERGSGYRFTCSAG